MVYPFLGVFLEIYSHMGAFPNQFSCVDIPIRYSRL